MDGSQSFTAAQAADPGTPAHVLADIAAQRPDLRAALAANPAIYPALLSWLSDLHDPAVDAALAARSAPGLDRPTPLTPSANPSSTNPTPSAASGPQDAGRWAGPAPYVPGPGAPPVPPTRPAPSTTSAERTYSTSTHYEASAPTPFGSGLYAGPPPGSGTGSRTALWVALAVVAAVVLVGVGAFAVMRTVTRTMTSVVVPDVSAPVGGSAAEGSYGDDPRLDDLWDQCAAGSGSACDDLYLESPFDSEYEEFGDTCGYRQDGGAWCAEG